MALALAATIAVAAFGQDDAYGHLRPKVYCVEENGQRPEPADTLEAGVPFVGAAPMRIVCEAHVEGPEGMTWRSEWNVSRSATFDSYELTRFDDDTTFDLNESGTYYIRLQATYVYADGREVPDETEAYAIQVSESMLKVPNAFSPNDDGINDVFRVSYRSLVRFEAHIYNRWGQQLHRWGLDSIDEGWDGTYHGKPVKDGVYFIVVEAEGSDGIKYKHKGDITLLRGYTAGTSTGGTDE